jgi:hypothetical protein
MSTLVTGDRDRICFDLAITIVRRLVKRYGPDIVIVHGACRGVDDSFRSACRWLGINDKAHVPDWTRFGDAAGPKRNVEMIAAGADLCVAFHRSIETSKGTKDCVKQALAAGIAVYLVEDDRGIPRRVGADDRRLR